MGEFGARIGSRQPPRRSDSRWIWWWPFAVLLLVGSLGQAWADSFPSSLQLSVENDYLRLSMRRHYFMPVFDDNGNLTGYDIYRGGRFTIETTGGDPFTSGDDDSRLLGHPTSPFTSYTVVRVYWGTASGGGSQQGGGGTGGGTGGGGQQGGGGNGGGQQGGGGGLPGSRSRQAAEPQDFEIESMMDAWTDPSMDTTVRQESAGSRDLDFAWLIPEGAQGVTTVVDALAGATSRSRVSAEVGVSRTAAHRQAASQDGILVEQRLALVRDLVRVEYRLTNRGTAAAEVGLRVFLDPVFGNLPLLGNDGQPIDLPEVGQITNETLLPDLVKGLQVPESWRCFDLAASPSMILSGLLRGADIETVRYSAGAPEQVVFGQFRLMNGLTFDYTPVGGRLANENWATAVRWDPRPLQVGQSRTYVTYIGLGGATSNVESPYVLAVEAPFSLSLKTGDDPSTVEHEPLTHVYRAPSPFRVNAFVTNISDRPLSGVSVSLLLPNGLELAEAGERQTKSIASLPVDQEGVVSWQVRPIEGGQAGGRSLVVAVSGVGLPGKTITREVEIPALPTLVVKEAARRLDMVSVPFEMANSDIESVLGSLGSIGLGGGSAAVARWNPQTQRYHFFPDPFITTVRPGIGFWLYNASLRNIELPATGRGVVPLTERVAIPLEVGWNQIGCPYVVSTEWLDAEVTFEDTIRSLSDASRAGLLRSTLYSYVPNFANPEERGEYQFSAQRGTLLEPWRGYWVKALRPVLLIINPPSVVGPFRSRPRAEAEALPPGGWKAPLLVQAEGLTEGQQWFGVSPQAADGYDPLDIDQPPPLRTHPSLRLSFVHRDWGENSGPYLQDIRSPIGEGVESWEFEVSTDLPEADVTLRWPRLQQVPPEYALWLEDRETGQRIALRTQAAYTYRSGAQGGTRCFRLIASRRQATRLRVMRLQVVPGRGGELQVQYELSQPARGSLEVLSLAGRPLYRGRTEEMASRGTLRWSRREGSGRLLPPGVYLVRVVFEGEQGVRTTATRAVTVGPAR